MDDFHNFAKSRSLKEPPENCNQFPYFEKSNFFEETSKQIQDKFLQTCCTSKKIHKEPQPFSDVKSGVRAKLNKNEITTSK